MWKSGLLHAQKKKCIFRFYEMIRGSGKRPMPFQLAKVIQVMRNISSAGYKDISYRYNYTEYLAQMVYIQMGKSFNYIWKF